MPVSPRPEPAPGRVRVSRLGRCCCGAFNGLSLVAGYLETDLRRALIYTNCSGSGTRKPRLFWELITISSGGQSGDLSHDTNLWNHPSFTGDIVRQSARRPVRRRLSPRN